MTEENIDVTTDTTQSVPRETISANEIEQQKQAKCWEEVSQVLQKHGYKIEVNLNFKPL